MAYTNKKVSLKDIYLDLNNPRHEPLPNEAAAIAHLVENEKVKALAKDIATKGGISPLDGLGVFPSSDEPNKYISAEGNRRICALKLLANPEKAPSEQDQQYFKKLAEQVADLNRVEVTVFKNRESARPWIELRHSGAQSGVGTRSWDTDQQVRFSKPQQDKNHKDLQASLLIEYAIKSGLIPASSKKSIAITAITRYLSNRYFRKTLGLTNRKDLTLSVPQNEFNQVLRHFLNDASRKDSKVHSHSTADQREEYATHLKTLGIAPKSKKQPELTLIIPGRSMLAPTVGEESHTADSTQKAEVYSPTIHNQQLPPSPNPPTSEQPQNNVGQNPNPTMANTIDRPFSMPNPGEDQRPATSFAPTTSDQKSDITPAAPRMRTNRNPNDRKYIIPSSFRMPIQDKVLKRIFDELIKLEASTFTFSSSYLMRAFIETLFTIYITKKTGNRPNYALHKKINETAKRLVRDELFTEEEVKYLRVMLTVDHPHSANSLGFVIHGGAIPTKESMISLWDSLEHIIKVLLKEIK